MTEAAAPAAPATDTAPAAEVTAGAVAGTEAGTATPTPTPVAPEAPKPDAGQSIDALPDWAQQEIKNLRKENGASRTNAKQQAAEAAKQETLQSVAKALGLLPDDGPVDPEKLTQDLTTSRDEARQAKVELAVFKAAGTAGADPDALLDSRSFANKIGALDPAADDFPAKVSAAITDAITANPKFKTAAQAAGRSGTEMAGGTGESSVTAEQFKAMDYNAKAALFQSNPELYRQLSGTA